MDKEFEKKIRLCKEKIQARNPENLEMVTADIHESFMHYMRWLTRRIREEPLRQNQGQQDQVADSGGAEEYC
jgi:hypothetical protein